MKITYLPWDSDTFGFKVGDVKCTSEELGNLPQEIINAKDQKYELLYLKNLDVPNEYLSDGFSLVDKKVIYAQTITKPIIVESLPISSVLHQPLSNELLLLALQSGGCSRYYTDKKMPIHVYLSLYNAWINNSLNGSIASDVLVYKDNGKSVGMISYKKTGDVVTVGLVVVDHSYADKGIGSKLLQYFLSLFPVGTVVEVATQYSNSCACHFYEKNGFSIKTTQNIYHIWVYDYCNNIKK